MTTTTLDALLILRIQWRQRGDTFVFTNGVFDLLHVGHVAYLEAARRLGHVLVVGINSDASTRAIKGPQRPLVPATDRATVLAALRSVDYVTVFEEPTAEHLVARLQPDVYVKGGDYALADPAAQETVVDEQRLPEAQVVHSYGGRVILLPYRAEYSTTTLIERIQRLQDG